MMETFHCPACGAPAEVLPWSTAASTSGSVELVKTTCSGGHWFLLSRDMVPVAQPVSPERAGV